MGKVLWHGAEADQGVTTAPFAAVASAASMEPEVCPKNLSDGAGVEGVDTSVHLHQLKKKRSEIDQDDSDSDTERPFSPTSVLDPPDWGSVRGLDLIQLSALRAVATKGVQWTNPRTNKQTTFTLHFGGEVKADGNCLFSTVHKMLNLAGGSIEVRRRTVGRFLRDYNEGVLDKEKVDQVIRHLYSPDLETGWGVHFVQEVKFLAKRSEREALNKAVSDLVECGMSREAACETVFKERCRPVDNGLSWSDYMSISGADTDENDIVSLQYTEEGLLAVDENASGRSAAFGDDIAIESIATEFAREIFVVQAHGSEAMMDSEAALFFLPHKPRGVVDCSGQPPLFFFMKGTGWCGAGADHYEPIVAREVPKSENVLKAAVSI